MLFTIILIVVGSFLQNILGLPVLQDTQDLRPFIVGGETAPLNYAPHMMALVFGTHMTHLMCGASIVSELHVLTAAHCVCALIAETDSLMPSLRGVYGSNKWMSTEKRARFSRHEMHPDYDLMELKYDIGVLFLSEKLTSSDKWEIVPLNYDIVEPGTKAYVTGWGSIYAWGPNADKLQLMYLETISHEKCVAGVIKASEDDPWIPTIKEDIELCTLHPDGEGQGMCHGDSGSALVSLDINAQIGIVSWGFPCATGAPDIFVRLSGFRKYLDKIFNESSKESIIEN